jgi:hypothetical protein
VLMSRPPFSWARISSSISRRVSVTVEPLEQFLQLLPGILVQHRRNHELHHRRVSIPKVCKTLTNNPGFGPCDSHGVLGCVLMPLGQQQTHITAKAQVEPDQPVVRAFVITF